MEEKYLKYRSILSFTALNESQNLVFHSLAHESLTNAGTDICVNLLWIILDSEYLLLLLFAVCSRMEVCVALLSRDSSHSEEVC